MDTDPRRGEDGLPPDGQDTLPPAGSWRVGRPWMGVLFGLLACANIAIAVVELTSGDGATTAGRVLSWLRLLVAVAFLVVAVGEFRRRVAVDAEGVHVIATFRRRTYPWHEVSEVRSGRPTLLGDRYVYLLRNGDKHVELESSGGHLDRLQRWHTAMSIR